MRLMVILLGALVVVGSVVGVEAKKRKKSRTSIVVVVESRLPADWYPFVDQAVQEIRGQLPEHAIILRSLQGNEGPCPTALPRRIIILCFDEALTYPESTAETSGVTRSGRIEGGYIRIRPSPLPTKPLVLLCHELSHAVTGSSAHGEWVNVRPCPVDVKTLQTLFISKRSNPWS